MICVIGNGIFGPTKQGIKSEKILELVPSQHGEDSDHICNSKYFLRNSFGWKRKGMECWLWGHYCYLVFYSYWFRNKVVDEKIKLIYLFMKNAFLTKKWSTNFFAKVTLLYLLINLCIWLVIDLCFFFHFTHKLYWFLQKTMKTDDYSYSNILFLVCYIKFLLLNIHGTNENIQMRKWVKPPSCLTKLNVRGFAHFPW